MNAPVSTLDERRAKAREDFRASGLPSRRVEDWKYSDLKIALGDGGFGEDQARACVGVPKGVEQFDLSSGRPPAWVRDYLGTLTKNAVSDASLAFARDGIALRVPPHSAIKESLIVDLSGPGHVRVLLVLEAGASLTVLEANELVGPRNAGIEIVLGAGATLEHVRIAKAGAAVQVEEIALSLAAGARYRAHLADFGSKLSRTELHVMLEGEGAEVHLSGVSVLDGKHADVTTHVTHASGKTLSTQLFKYVAAGPARGIYQGKVTVAQGANGADSRQTAKGLLLGNRAEIDLKPELEILADDVKCAHGAAVGDLDTESLFYLRSRGIPEAEARALLMRAFIGDAVEQIEDEAVRASIWQAVDAALEGLS